jgi:lysozyme family protein
MAVITDSLISYIKKAEGGLSRATTDTASKKPSPYVYKGVTGWHTNKGVKWETFEFLAPSAGYEVTADNFLNMPDSVWGKIFKIGYWDELKCSEYQSQAIANAVGDWAWASGAGGARSALKRYLLTKGITAKDSRAIAAAFNILVAKDGEKKVYNDLINERIRFFKALNQPANEKGWINRMEKLRALGSEILKDLAGSEIVKDLGKSPAGIGGIMLIGIAFLTYLALKK